MITPNVLTLQTPPATRLPSTPIVDAVTQGGIVQGSRVLLTGDSNAGKTTLALCMADALTANGHAPWFLSLEMGPQLVTEYVRRLGLTHGFGVGFDAWMFPQFVRDNAPRHPVLIVDSLQAIADKPVTALHALFRFADEHGATLVVIGQGTKSGGFRGPLTLMHDVDLHLHLSTPTERWANAQARWIRVMKNRHGPNLALETRLTATGHVRYEPPIVAARPNRAPPIPLWGWLAIVGVALADVIYTLVR